MKDVESRGILERLGIEELASPRRRSADPHRGRVLPLLGQRNLDVGGRIGGNNDS